MVQSGLGTRSRMSPSERPLEISFFQHSRSSISQPTAIHVGVQALVGPVTAWMCRVEMIVTDGLCPSVVLQLLNGPFENCRWHCFDSVSRLQRLKG